MMNKKGFTFNWIFVLIAGTLLLLFFVGFAYKHIGISTQLGNKQILFNLESDIQSYSKALQSDKILKIPQGLNVDFRCGGLHVEEEFKETDLLIFSPNQLQGDIYIWTQSWDYPFKITNMFYVASKETTFFVVDNAEIFQEIPQRFKKVFLNQGNNLISSKLMDPKAVFVFGGDVVLPSNYKAKVVQIYPNLELKINGQSTQYYGDSLLYGAIFSKNYEDFVCLQNKALDDLERIIMIYKGKADLLKIRRECSLMYNELSRLLGEFVNNPGYYDLIKNQNRNLEKSGCAPVY